MNNAAKPRPAGPSTPEGEVLVAHIGPANEDIHTGDPDPMRGRESQDHERRDAVTEQRESKAKVDKLMGLLARPPEAERNSTNEQELKWNAERRRAVEKERQSNRLEWYRYHARLANHHARLADEHRDKADALDPGDPGAVLLAGG